RWSPPGRCGPAGCVDPAPRPGAATGPAAPGPNRTWSQDRLKAMAATALLLGFVHRLRGAGIGVAMVEAVAAMRSLGHVDVAGRGQFKAALEATLIKRAEDRATFEGLFEEYFRANLRVQVRQAEQRPLPGPLPGGEGEVGEEDPVHEMPAEDLLESILAALRANDLQALRVLARAAAQQFGNIDPS